MTAGDLRKPQEGKSAASTGDTAGPEHSGAEMLGLTREACLQLLARNTFGRLAVTLKDHPVIRPVNYVFDQPMQSVVFRTAQGSKLHAMLHAARASFEIDGTDEHARTGWSVIIVGVTEEITNLSDVRRLDSLGLETWAPGPKPHWVRIRARTVSGRRIVLAADRPPTTPPATAA